MVSGLWIMRSLEEDSSMYERYTPRSTSSSELSSSSSSSLSRSVSDFLGVGVLSSYVYPIAAFLSLRLQCNTRMVFHKRVNDACSCKERHTGLIVGGILR